MLQLNIYEAKTQFSRIIAAVERGEEVVIARAGRPVARVVPLQEEGRAPGWGRDLVRYEDDWDSDETNADVAAQFLDTQDR